MATSSLAAGRQTLAAVRIFVILTLLAGVLYPAAVWAVGQVAFRDQAAGSLVRQDGRTVGSSLLGQSWTGDQWFHSRPSASDYAGDASGGSNLPADDPRLQKEVSTRRTALESVGITTFPPDALTASGSGLDPHISPAYAEQQVARVAAARHLDVADVRRLVERYTQGRTLGYLGEPRVNVLELNLALTRMH